MKIKELVKHPTLQYPLFSNGYPRPKGNIIIDGVEVEVGGELFSALHRLHRLWSDPMAEVQYVWIDALCINQEDVEERNKHVLQMSEIYEKARGVRIWLGEAVSVADRIAIELLTDISKVFSELLNKKDWESAHPKFSRLSLRKTMKEFQWNCLSCLLNRTWVRTISSLHWILVTCKVPTHMGNPRSR